MRHHCLAALGLAAAGLAACSNSDSVGFTGIGAEPATVAQRATEVKTVAPATVVYTPAFVPEIAAPAQAGPASQRAETAIRYGGTTPRRSVPVAMGGTMLALSIVDVGGQDYAVLRVPADMPRGRVPDAARAEFSANAATLTGCLPRGPVQGSGRARGSDAGLALPLDCS